MRKLIFVGFLLFTIAIQAQQVELLKLDKLNELITAKSSSLKVINFWASWCAPCVKEMPHFDEIGQRRDVELYFVSLDFPSQKGKANDIIIKKGIQSKSFLLDEKDADKYIASINEVWSGAIPATLFIESSGKKTFYEKALEKDELERIVKNLTSK